MKKRLMLLLLSCTITLCGCNNNFDTTNSEPQEMSENNTGSTNDPKKLTRESIDKSKYTETSLEDAKTMSRITGILGTTMDDSGSSHLSDEDYKFISSTISIYGIDGKIVYGYTEGGDAKNIIDLATWTTKDVVENNLDIIEPMILDHGNDYRIGDFLDYSEAYLWESIDGYDAIACCENTDGTMSIIWNSAIVTIKEPTIGMTAEEVRNSTWGEPDDINKTTTKYGTSEQWVYKNSNDFKYIYLDNGIVTAIQE